MQRFDIVMHVHDEAVIEVDEDLHTLETINKIMSEPNSWAPDCPDRDSYSTPYYKRLVIMDELNKAIDLIIAQYRC